MCLITHSLPSLDWTPEAALQEALARVLEDRKEAAADADAREGSKGGQQSQQGGEQHGRSGKNKKKKKGDPREFDFSRFRTRHIALQLSYEGDRYMGFSTRVRGQMYA